MGTTWKFDIETCRKFITTVTYDNGDVKYRPFIKAKAEMWFGYKKIKTMYITEACLDYSLEFTYDKKEAIEFDDYDMAKFELKQTILEYIKWNTPVIKPKIVSEVTIEFL